MEITLKNEIEVEKYLQWHFRHKGKIFDLPENCSPSFRNRQKHFFGKQKISLKRQYKIS